MDGVQTPHARAREERAGLILQKGEPEPDPMATRLGVSSMTSLAVAAISIQGRTRG